MRDIAGALGRVFGKLESKELLIHRLTFIALPPGGLGAPLRIGVETMMIYKRRNTPMPPPPHAGLPFPAAKHYDGLVREISKGTHTADTQLPGKFKGDKKEITALVK